MDGNEVMQTETVDTWDDDYLSDEVFTDESGDTEEDFEFADEADQPEAEEEPEPTEEKTAEESSDPETEEEPVEEKQPETEAKSFKLKHLDEEIEVDEAKVVELAQKGMDYDRIREKYNGINAEMPRYKEYESFLNELAAGANQTIEELIDSSRARMLIAKEQSEGRTMGEAEAMLRVQRQRKTAAAAPAEDAKDETAEVKEEPKIDEQAVRKQQFRDLIQAFPDIKADEIPKEVFEEAQKSGNLFVAYSNYRMKLLAEENKKLKQEQKNRQRATGSMQSKGAAPKKDKFDELWYDGT